MTGTDQLDVRNLSASRGGRPVFRDLSFSLASGGALRLAGRNGGGKTTLLRIVAGLGRADTGEVLWNGEPVTDDREAHAGRVGWLGHADALKTALTARENVEAALRVAGRPTDRLGDALDALALTRLAELPAGWLSSGQRRRTALARVLASGASLWLLDEPTVGLDAASVAALERAIAAHRAEGGMVIAATHTALDLGDDAVDLDPAAHADAGRLPEAVA
ncbi:cytochrome c biogenesis ATP-binding export protein CcmA [Thalassobaculum fulvum]|jgi:heme exporter protein A|uniref:Cytochrome c biogenesis ATP-binding export protein CcmA n=1 Tax=Thalassobaculum fulvum TaxID=1633335 RepID=A0A918XNU3_9PROT|nr:cytochrome c biogenesis heme-transporting ATPase CcmA [Thalassobaculum fulvum]GHD43026.1 cytochrome c biogenesis ATP-binding export protein CcmA [Thalassobaculum fulvum]